MSVVRRWVSAVGPVITGVCSEKKVLTSTVIEAESDKAVFMWALKENIYHGKLLFPPCV